MGMIASERVFKLMDNNDFVPANNREAQKNNPHKISMGAVCFQHVWFAYLDEQYVLKDISFSIKAGETRHCRQYR
jgi:ATP-binding cassette subfamily B protein